MAHHAAASPTYASSQFTSPLPLIDLLEASRIVHSLCAGDPSIFFFFLFSRPTLIPVQEVIDCAVGDCVTGGYPSEAFRFISSPPVILGSKIATEDVYPFTAGTGDCQVSTAVSTEQYVSTQALERKELLKEQREVNGEQ